MMGKRTSRWLIRIALLLLFLAGLGCSVCPFVPQLATSTPLPPTDTPTPRATPTPQPTPTPDTSVEMDLYTNSTLGFSVFYPQDWAYQLEQGGVFFSESVEVIETADLTKAPFFIVFAGIPKDIEYEFGSTATAQGLLDALVEEVCGEECKKGESREHTFGEISGAGMKVSWLEMESGERFQSYFVAAVSDEVAGVGLGVVAEDDWPDYEQIFQDMFASLEFFPPEIPEPVEQGAIQPGEMEKGVLPLNGEDVWTFDAQEGQYATIGLDAVDSDGLDTYLELYDEDGIVIAEDDDGGMGTDSLIFDFQFDASGVYYIHVSAYSGAGDYRVSLEIADASSGGGEIEFGETVEAMLRGGGEHEWEFSGSEGDEIRIAMNATEGDLDCYLELYSPDGDQLFYDDDSGQALNALIDYFVLPEDGLYRIVASDLSGESGEYELDLEMAQLEVEGNLVPGQAAAATLELAERHHWLFEGEAGDIVNISLASDDDDLDTYLELYAPSGEQVTTDDDGGEGSSAAIWEFELPHTGTYRVVARGYNEEESGDYTITLEMVELEIVGTLVYDQETSATLEPGRRHHWLFEGEAGDMVDISMVSVDGDMDTYLELYDPDGEQVVTDDDSGGNSNAAILEFALPQTGTYRVVARSFSGGQAGDYTITLEMTQLEIAGTLVYDQAVSATLEPGDRHHWLFEGQAGDVVTIAIIAVNEDMDTYLELYDPDGEQVWTDDDSGGDSNAAIIEFELLLDGDYRVVARGYNSYATGDYELTLTGP